MKKKNVMIISIVCLLTALTACIVLGVRAFQKSRLTAEIESVANLNIGYFEDGMQSDGIVTNDDSQSIYLENGQQVTDVYVSEGQSVLAGDLLMAYDVSSLTFSLEIKKMEIETLHSQLLSSQTALEQLMKTKPSAPVTVPLPDDPTSVLPPQKTDEGVYTYIAADTSPNIKSEDDSVLHYLCTKEAFVLGSFFNQLTKDGKTAVFEVRENDQFDGQQIASWQVNGALLSDKYDDEARYDVLTGSSNVTSQEPQIPENSYTAEELAKAIREKNKEIKQLDLEIRKAELALSDLESQIEDGLVYAKINGVVKSAGDPANPPSDGSAFLQVAGSEGLYVKGTVSELQLEHIQIGQEVVATNWQNGQTYIAKIDSIDRYPADNSYYYGQGNPNSSYYGYTAYIENPEGLVNGEYLQLVISKTTDSLPENTIYLQQCYVREENGQPYVLKDENGRLKKQFVKTGKILWGNYVEIQSGLTEADWIAFPYGKTAKEGVKTSAKE